MKNLYFFGICAICLNHLIAQTTQFELSTNDSKILLQNNGLFFYNATLGIGEYYVPTNSTVSPIYLSSFLAAGTDQNNTVRGFFSDYVNKELFNGPIAGDYTNSTYINSYQQGIWFVSKADIYDHLTNYNVPNYIVPTSIANWPAHGNIQNGEAFNLAPFVDVDQDGTYRPELGDYPCIRGGDGAAFLIMNDQNGLHNASGLTALGVELHVMVYQYNSNDDLARTNFFEVKIINRSTETYNDFKFGLFNDFDLGYYSDDLIGTHVEKKLSYVYNGDLIDEQGPANPGYGSNPPAFGVMGLNKNLFANVPYGGENFIASINGKNPNGSDILDNNGNPTNFIYNGTSLSGYTEATYGMAGDKRSTMTFEPFTFAPNQELVYDFAYIYARETSPSDLFSCVEKLFTVADFVQNFYDGQNFDCEDQINIMGLSNLQENVPEVFPNPAKSFLYVKNASPDATFQIISTDGKMVDSGSISEYSIPVEKLEAGIYHLTIGDAKSSKTYRFIKEK